MIMVDGIEFDKDIDEPTVLEKRVRVQHTGRQFFLPLPVDFIDVMDIEKGDVFIIKVPLDNKGKYSIKLEKNIHGR